MCLALENAGYRCRAAYSGAEAADLIEAGRWALVVLDVMLPDHDGYELKNLYRRRNARYLSHCKDRRRPARVKGLAAGAQDYICKPFEPAELVARVEAALRRTGRGRTVLQACGVTLDPVRRTVCKNGAPVAAYPARIRPFAGADAQQKRRIVPQCTVRARVGRRWPRMDSRTLDLHIQRLRKKLGLAGRHQDRI